ncbi:MAG: DNA-directed RNA polymerase sigma-70 factor [Phycisphaeraceae bacterium]|nr:MAG: DNA-directed RNA polymerase sigma-70 factor [Phycisphaeraceae bacterium]
MYDDLRSVAGQHLRHERVGHTMTPTALVHEAYLRLMGAEPPEVTSRSHLLGIIARLMRQILVNHALAKKTLKRGGGRPTLSLEAATVALEERSGDLVALDEALGRLAQIDPRQAAIVELRFFGNLTIQETADVLGVSARSVVSGWAFARAWLHGELRCDEL